MKSLLKRFIPCLKAAFLLCAAIDLSFAQDPHQSGSLLHTYRFEEHSRLNGLNTLLIKSFCRTQNGRAFVGSDNELLVFDGKEWRAIPPSESGIRIKYLLETEDGDLWVLSDFKLHLVQQTDTGYEVSEYIAFDDPDLHRSKLLFESADGGLWIAANEHVFKYEHGKLTKYRVPYERIPNRNYLRTFFFLEDHQEQMFLISYLGEAFCLKNGKFERVSWSGPNEVFTVCPMGKDEFLLGTDRGLEYVNASEGVLNAPEIKVPVQWVSDVVLLEGGKVVFSTYQFKVFEIEDIRKSWQERMIREFDEHVFRMFVDHDGSIWMLMENKIYRAAQNPIIQLAYQSPSPFVNKFMGDRVLFADRGSLLAASPSGDTELIAQFPVDIWCAIADGERIFVGLSDRNLKILDYKGNTLKTIQLDAAISYMHIDQDGVFWSNRVDLPGVVRIRYPEILEVYGANQIPTLVSCVKSSSNGELFVGGNDVEAFLFQYSKQTNTFTNLGRLDPEDNRDFQEFGVNDFTFDGDGRLMIATTLGVLRYHPGKYCEFQDFGTYSAHEFLSFRRGQSSDDFWATSYDEIIRLKEGEVTVFDKMNGLPGSPENYRNLMLSDNVLWAGTQKGVVYLSLDHVEYPSAKPKLFSVISNGKFSRIFPESVSDENQMFLEFGSPNFPPKASNYEFSVIDIRDNHVMAIQRNTTGHFVPEIKKSGHYRLEVRCRAMGNYGWSEKVVYEFEVYSTKFRQIIYSLLSVSGFIFVISFVFVAKQRANLRRIQELDKLVQDRTVDLETKNNELLNSNRVKDKLFSIISHDLRGPVGSSSLLLDLTLENVESGDLDKLKQDLRLIARETKSTHELLENLLSWASYQSGAIQLKLEEVDLKQAIVSIETLFSGQLSSKNIQFEIDLSVDTIVTDKNCLQTVLRNLVGNAVKYCSEGDQIIIRNFENDNGDGVYFEVSDTGPGMDPDVVKKVLDENSFYTTKGSRHEKGNGLGISICQEILSMIGGGFDIKSEVGKGTEFRFWVSDETS